MGHGAALLVGQVHHAPPVLLKGLARQDLREEVRGVVVGRDVLDGHDPSASQLAHLVELAIDVARMLRSAEPVAKIVCASVVRIALPKLATWVAVVIPRDPLGTWYTCHK